MRTLAANLLRTSDENLGLLDLAAFDQFLCTKIPEKFHSASINLKQKILKMFSAGIPEALTLEFGYYEDERRGCAQDGLSLVKNLH